MGKYRVLVIDEDKNSIDLFGRALKPEGVDVFVIGTPDKGIEKAIEIEPNLIFVNLIFQDSNGLKVSRLIHKIDKLRNVPIIMMIVKRSDLDPKYTSTIGVVDVLIKPLQMEDIHEKTMSVLWSGYSAGAGPGVPGGLPETEGLEGFEEDEPSLAGIPGGTETAEYFREPVEEQDFVREADLLIDQAIIGPGSGKKATGSGDRKVKDTVIHIRKPDQQKDSKKEIPEVIIDEEIKMEKRNLFDEDEDRKEDAIKRSFDDEFDELVKDEPLKQAAPVDDESEEYEDAEEEKPDIKKKVLMAVGGLVVIAGLGFGGYQLSKMYFKGGEVAVKPPQPEVVKESLPPAGEVKPEQPPATAQSSDTKAKPPVAEVAKKEPAPAAAPAQPAAQKEPEKPAAAQTKPAAKPEAKPAPVEPVKQKPEPPTKAAAVKEAKPAAKETAKAAKQEKTAPEKMTSKFAVQAGYFGTAKNAETLVESLKKKGYEPYIVKGEAAGKSFHRVLVGKFDSNKKAAEFAKSMKQKDNLSVVVYRN